MWFVKDPCGRLYAALLHLMLLMMNVVLCCLILRPTLGTDAWPSLLVHETGWFLCFWSHLAAMFTDPGSLQGGGEERGIGSSGLAAGVSVEGVRWCDVCFLAKRSRAHHCRTCKRCVAKMDHHCVWINNCVGARNQKLFVLFLCYVEVHCVLSFFSLAFCMVSCLTRFPPVLLPSERGQVGRDDTEVLGVECPLVAATAVLMVLVMVGLFVGNMLGEQVLNIRTNTTSIERLQGTTTASRPAMESLQDVMGGSVSWRWLVPHMFALVPRSKVADAKR